MRAPALAKIAIAVAALSLLAGCSSYDYLQRTDRVAYSAGDAVHANLERETMSPSKRSMYATGGLGKDGAIVGPTAPATTSLSE